MALMPEAIKFITVLPSPFQSTFLTRLNASLPMLCNSCGRLLNTACTPLLMKFISLVPSPTQSIEVMKLTAALMISENFSKISSLLSHKPLASFSIISNPASIIGPRLAPSHSPALLIMLIRDSQRTGRAVVIPSVIIWTILDPVDMRLASPPLLNHVTICVTMLPMLWINSGTPVCRIPATRLGMVDTICPIIGIMLPNSHVAVVFATSLSNCSMSPPVAMPPSRFLNAAFIALAEPSSVDDASFAVVPVMFNSPWITWIASYTSARLSRLYLTPVIFCASFNSLCISVLVPP